MFGDGCLSLSEGKTSHSFKFSAVGRGDMAKFLTSSTAEALSALKTA